MKTKTIHRRPFWSALAVVATLFLALLMAAPQAQANIGAGATILNTVQVDYKDASGKTSYSANATTTVTVNLVQAALTYSGRPTGGSATPALPAGQTVDSGATASYLIALTANANGGDTYSLSRTIGALTNIATGTEAVTYATVRNDGTTQISDSPANVALGASVIQANTANTISIPGGSTVAAAIETNAAGFKVLVVNGVDYIVTGITTGTAPSNTHLGNVYQTTIGTAVAETLAVITLAANPSGSNTAPAFGVNALKGTLAREQILVKVDVTGVVGTTVGVDGVVPFTLTTTDSSAGNSTTSTAIDTTFRASNLRVQKNVRNLGPTGVLTPAFAATANGNPGDILEYQVLVNHPGGAVAKEVKAADAVPVYTQLVCGAAGLGTAVCPAGAGTEIIATVYDGTNTYNVTYQTDVECAGTPAAAGNAAGFAEGSAINFYLGHTCNGATPVGGNVTSGTTYTITYRVKMN